MEITGKDLFFAGLMGSNAVGVIQRSGIVQNELAKRVLPTIPFLPVDNTISIQKDSFGMATYDPINGWTGGFRGNNWQQQEAIPEAQQFFPLSFSFTEGGQKWMFPYEPMINISSGNNIVKRNVAKQGDKLIGAIKERWSRKDFDISVTGVLIGKEMKGSAEDCFPRVQMEQLLNYLVYSKEIYVYCHPLEILGITKVVVEDYSFPFTKGENVQAYDIKLTSDYSYNLLIKEEF